jgi:hypothetical protein
MPHIPGVSSSSKKTKFSDDFNRTQNSTINDTSKPWVSNFGDWGANGTRAIGKLAASSYPIAYIPFSQNSTQSAKVDKGMGLVFWHSSAGSWWATVSRQVTTSFSYSCNPYSCNCVSCNCTTSGGDAYSCSGGSYPNCAFGSTATYTGQSCDVCPSGYYSYFGYCGSGSCGGYPCSIVNQGSYNCVNNYSYSCNSGTCYTPVSTSCSTCCSTCYSTCSGSSDAFYLRLLKSVGGTVSEATSSISLSSPAVMISTTVSGETITSKAYSDEAMTSQLGTTLSHTAVSPAKGYGVGIIRTPSDSQGDTVDNYSVNI